MIKSKCGLNKVHFQALSGRYADTLIDIPSTALNPLPCKHHDSELLTTFAFSIAPASSNASSREARVPDRLNGSCGSMRAHFSWMHGRKSSLKTEKQAPQLSSGTLRPSAETTGTGGRGSTAFFGLPCRPPPVKKFARSDEIE